MPFLESERVLYRKNPLVEVICQLRFPTILRIGAGKPADFQDRVRKDYPLYDLVEPSIPQLPKELAAILEQIQMPKISAPSTHRFYTKDSHRFISLSQDFLALVETKYERWESFREQLAKSESALKEVYEPAFYTRIGLRYRDIISRQTLGLTNVGWQELLKPHVVGELGDKEVSNAISMIHTRASIKMSEIPEAQITLNHGLTKPPGRDEDCYIIDADFWVERKEGVGDAFEILDKFNRFAGRLFRWAITEKLHLAMEPQRI